MTGDRFSEIDLAIQVRLFNAAFQNSMGIVMGIRTFLSANGWRRVVAIFIQNKGALVFNGPDTRRSKIGSHVLLNFFHDGELAFFERSPEVAFHTTGPFA